MKKRTYPIEDKELRRIFGLKSREEIIFSFAVETEPPTVRIAGARIDSGLDPEVLHDKRKGLSFNGDGDRLCLACKPAGRNLWSVMDVTYTTTFRRITQAAQRRYITPQGMGLPEDEGKSTAEALSRFVQTLTADELSVGREFGLGFSKILMQRNKRNE